MLRHMCLCCIVKAWVSSLGTMVLQIRIHCDLKVGVSRKNLDIDSYDH